MTKEIPDDIRKWIEDEAGLSWEKVNDFFKHSGGVNPTPYVRGYKEGAIDLYALLSEQVFWNDQRVKQYAEGYRFSSSRLSIEQFKSDPDYWNKEEVNENYKLALEESFSEQIEQKEWKWIELKEGCEMPDYDEYVLWLHEDGNMFVEALDKDGNPWIFGEEFQGFTYPKATHWRKLPALPQNSNT